MQTQKIRQTQQQQFETAAAAIETIIEFLGEPTMSLQEAGGVLRNMAKLFAQRSSTSDAKSPAKNAAPGRPAKRKPGRPRKVAQK